MRVRCLRAKRSPGRAPRSPSQHNVADQLAHGLGRVLGGGDATPPRARSNLVLEPHAHARRRGDLLHGLISIARVGDPRAGPRRRRGRPPRHRPSASPRPGRPAAPRAVVAAQDELHRQAGRRETAGGSTGIISRRSSSGGPIVPLFAERLDHVVALQRADGDERDAPHSPIAEPELEPRKRTTVVERSLLVAIDGVHLVDGDDTCGTAAGGRGWRGACLCAVNPSRAS